jgi:hypothetical protein
VVLYNPIPALANFSVANGDSVSTSQGEVTVSPGNRDFESTTAEMIVKLGTLNAGASATITLKVHVTGDGDLAENAIVVSDSPDTFLDNNTFRLDTTAQPLTTSFVFGGAFTAGGVLNDPLKLNTNTGSSTTGRFNWALTNTGGDPPQHIVVKMTVPATLRDIAAYPPSTFNSFQNPDGTTSLTFAWPTIASGDTVNFGFTARPTALGDIPVTATVTDDGKIAGTPPALTKTLTAHVQAEVTSLALRGVLVGDASGSPMAYDPGTSTVVTSGIFGWKLQNTGDTALTGVNVTIPLTGLPLTNVIPDAYIDSILNSVGNASYDPGTNTVTISLPDLPARGKPVNFGFLADPTATGEIAVTAHVAVNELLTGPPPSHTAAYQINTTIESPAASMSLASDLAIVSGSANGSGGSGESANSVAAGGAVNVMTINATTGAVDNSGKFTWKLKNNGSTPVTGVHINIPSLQQLKNIVSFAGGNYLPGTAQVTFDFPTIAAGETKTFGFAADPKAIGPLSVTAYASASQPLVGGGGALSETISTVVFSSLTHQLENPDPSLPKGSPQARVIAHADLVPVFYGKQWTKPGAGDSWTDYSWFPSQMDTAMSTLVNGPLMDLLSEYSTQTTKIGRGKSEAGLIVNAATPDGTAPAVLDDTGDSSAIKAIIGSQIQSVLASTGAVPDPQNTVYVIYAPPGVKVTASFGDSTANFAGFHGYDVVNRFDTASGQLIATYAYPYIVMPWNAPPNMAVQPNRARQTVTPFQSMTMSFSHELAETVTDPNTVTGWRDYSFVGANEIGDLAQNSAYQLEPEGVTWDYGMLDSYAIQYEWANEYTYPGTDFTIFDQPVLPRDGKFNYLEMKRVVDPFRRTIAAATGESSGYSFSGLIASFHDGTNSSNDPSVYSVTIDWGDSTTSDGAVTYDPNLNQFLVSGSHTFASAAGSAASVSVAVVNNSSGDQASLVANVTLQETSADAAQVQSDPATAGAYRTGSRPAITVDRVGAAAVGETVDFHVSGGTAVDGTDYQAESGTLVFSPGATTATIVLPVYANPAATSDLTVNLALSTPTGNTVLGTQTTTLVTIHPSDKIFTSPAPQLDSDTGADVFDDVTDVNGAPAAPLIFKIADASIRNGFVQLVDVTDPANPLQLGNPVHLTDGAAAVTVNDGALADGMHRIAFINSLSVGSTPSRASQTLQVLVDSAAPASVVSALPARTLITSLPVSWAGNDNAGGTGVSTYDISVSVDGGNPIPWLTGTALTSSAYTASLGHKYAFFAQATDIAGNVEPGHVNADTSVAVTATPWHNERHPLDVSNDGSIAPNDALIVINRINSAGSGLLPTSAAADDFYLDASGDNFVAPNDALLVINAINAGQVGPVQGEGENAVASGLADAYRPAASQLAMAAGLPDETLSDLIAQLAQDNAQAAENQKRVAAAAAPGIRPLG